MGNLILYVKLLLFEKLNVLILFKIIKFFIKLIDLLFVFNVRRVIVIF